MAPRRYLSRKLPSKAKSEAPSDWEKVAKKLGKAGWTWGCTSRIDSKGRTTFVADAYREDGKHFVVRADDRLTAFTELERQTNAQSASASPTAVSPEETAGSARDSTRQSKPPSQRPNIAVILGITFGIAFLLIISAYALHSLEQFHSRVRNENIASLRSPQAEPEIRKAIPLQAADSHVNAFGASAKNHLESQSLQFESVSPSPTASPVDQRTEITYHVTNIKPNDVLNLRAGPGSNYAVITEISPDTHGIVLSGKRAANGNTMWQEISVNGYTGWVNELYLETEQKAGIR